MDNIKKLSEEIEREALISLHEHCPSETRSILGLGLSEIADSVVAAAAKYDPSVVLNRTLGLGTKIEVSADSINAVMSFYQELEIGKYFIHIYPELLTGTGSSMLLDAGLVKSRGWMKFGRDNSSITAPPTDLRIEIAGSDKAHHFGRIVANAFGMTENAAELLSGLVHDPRWYLFLSYDGDTAAGAGALFVHNNCAWLEWGATDPLFRRRGSQGAIMAARINKAIKLGCTNMFTETGEAVEGDPQHSYKNILKAGFTESVLRENYTVT